MNMKKAFVGISGGVDSSVAAALLQDRGYDVTGVFARVWHPNFLECTWKDDRRDAKRVCAALGIPFVELDLEDEYRREVVDYMVSEYKAGRTPNPDVACNRAVKFGGLYDFAIKNGADIVATGHYAAIEASDGEHRLMRPADETKDQTYFLWAIGRDRLANVAFPIGDMSKDQVRACARTKGLFTAEKRDSQGLCFIGHVDMDDFLDRFAPSAPGDLLDRSGAIIGKHAGAIKYTIGRRHGFEVFKHGTDDEPLYVIAKDIAANTVIVGPKAAIVAATASCELTNTNWLVDAADMTAPGVTARIRHRGALVPCDIGVVDSGNTARISFKEPVEGLASGQSVVLYRDRVCLGGGVLK
jgi:tRNA-specific 2-thiouridylase